MDHYQAQIKRVKLNKFYYVIRLEKNDIHAVISSKRGLIVIICHHSFRYYDHRGATS